MAINFPASPSLNQTYTFEGRTWKWNGVGWQIYAANPAPEVGSQSVSTTIAVNPQATVVADVTLNPMVIIHKITSSVSAWTRLYHSTSAATSDANRSINTDPAPSAGVIAEIVTTSAAEAVTLSPVVTAINQESPRTSVFPVRVTNNDAVATSVTLTFDYVFLEI